MPCIISLMSTHSDFVLTQARQFMIGVKQCVLPVEVYFGGLHACPELSVSSEIQFLLKISLF